MGTMLADAVSILLFLSLYYYGRYEGKDILPNSVLRAQQIVTIDE